MCRSIMDKNNTNHRYMEEVKKLIEEHYYGKVTLSLEDGRIVFLKKEQTIKLK